MSSMKVMDLQAFYTHAELAKVANISRRRIERLLLNANLKTTRVGNRHVIFVCDLEEHLPQLWRSLVALDRARAFTRAFANMPRSPAPEKVDESDLTSH